ncbi:MAG: transcription repressor NadR [Clostridia bacterium]|nr:transcription repressor NadR [Clostridia bacterium]MDH7572132.1 transcription repressor NadR [Clostridia bacterium]
MRRRERILEYLRQAGKPVTGSQLAEAMGVSRQVIVQDIALLRAAGTEILATPQGYVWQPPAREQAARAVIAVNHPPEDTETELNLLVDFGLKVVDVVVEHPVYGELRGYLMLQSRRDVQLFLQRVQGAGAGLLCSLTGGVHLHTVEYSREEDFRLACRALAERGILLRG